VRRDRDWLALIKNTRNLVAYVDPFVTDIPSFEDRVLIRNTWSILKRDFEERVMCGLDPLGASNDLYDLANLILKLKVTVGRDED